MRALGAFSVLALASCATLRVAGDRCAPADAICMDSKTALSCRQGIAVSFACTGPEGCKEAGDGTAKCDQSSGARVGEPCFPEYTGRGQCAGETLLQCVNGAWAGVACPAGLKCQEDTGGVFCR